MEQITKGYKATDKDMKCRGFQFELDKWYEHEGDIQLCGAGFHFCTSPSGVYDYYGSSCRVFEIEVQEVLKTKDEAGSGNKKVCKKIRFVQEITPGGDRNTGDQNTGNLNTGAQNTGDRNTGDLNTGDLNTGDLNTGNLNTGDRNTGYRNTGDLNTGNLNTGDRNTGYRNTGHLNTGNCNATNFSSGFFNTVEPTVICFDVDTGLSRKDFLEKYPRVYDLCRGLLDDDLEFEHFKEIPGITKKKLAKLISLHKAGTKE